MEKNITFLGDSITAWNNFKGVKNYGVAGFTTLDLLWQLEKNEDIRGGIVVMMIGVNDVLSDFPPKKTFENLTKIIDILRERFERIILVSVLPTMYIDRNRTIKNLNFFLKEQLFLENLGIYNLFVNEDGVLDNKCTADGVHLSSYGYEILNNEIKKVIE